MRPSGSIRVCGHVKTKSFNGSAAHVSGHSDACGCILYILQEMEGLEADEALECGSEAAWGTGL